GGVTDAFVSKLSADGSSLLFSTYLGGSEYTRDYGQSIAVDGAGNCYITGYTFSSDFPTVNAYDNSFGGGVTDAFVSKLSAGGDNLLFSTYLGGENEDRGHSLAVDGAGNCYIAGYTQSTDFPTVNAYDSSYGWGHGDAFVSKLSAGGDNLLFSTYLGGENEDSGLSIAVDGAGNCYITGCTFSSDFPTVNAYDNSYSGRQWDAFVSKLSAGGDNLLFSTYLGGDDTDSGHSIAVDGAGNCYVTGYTQSTDFPTVNAYDNSYGGATDVFDDFDAFISKLSAGGDNLLFSTYLGGEEADSGQSIAVDGAGNCYVTGYTQSTDFPTVNAYDSSGGGYDAFISVFQLVCISTPKIKYPTAGTIANGTITIEWSAASDIFNHSITYSVYYSPDEGATWTLLASGLTSTSYPWDTNTVPNGFSYLIKVVVTCSGGSSIESISDEPFTIQNTISTSGPSFTFTPGMTSFVFFAAFVALITVRKGRKR
ncbi:MAG: SBBP repeat-containing protein, partial [Candidatus Odinarchaeota archaeon]